MVDRRSFLVSGALAVGTLTAGCPAGDRTRPDQTQTDEPTAEPETPEEPDVEAPTETPTQPEEAVTVAFIGDQGLRETSREVLRLIRREGGDVVVHSGDFDYANDPDAWNAMLTEELGADFPYLASIGGHDIEQWNGYRRVLRERARRVDGLEWAGDLGLQSACTYRGVMFVLTSVGFCEDEEDVERTPYPCKQITGYDQEQYISTVLSMSDAVWRVCSWHKPHDELNPGDKGTDTPISAYEVCRRHGALVATADEHAYARTHLMDDYSSRSVASRSPPYTIGNGRTFSFVSGIGGQSFYSGTEQQDAEWWATTCTEESAGTFGAFFCTFRADGTGRCYFKDIDGRTIDGPFEIRSAVSPRRFPGRATPGAATDGPTDA